MSVCVALAAWTWPLHAQEMPPEPPASVLTQLSLEELMDVEIVFSASRREQKISEAPSKVSIVTATEIQRYGYRTLADVLQSLPGFHVWSDRNYSYLGVRGFGRPGDYNSRVLLLIDGHRMNDNVYDQALIDNSFPLDIDMIERVEVVRGPSSSIYGTGAFFPVLINVVSRRGHVAGAEASVAAASFGTWTGRLSWGGKAVDGPELTFSGSALGSRGQNLYFPEFDTPQTNHGVAASADDERAWRLFANLTWGDFTLQAAGSSREKGIPTAPYGTIFDDNRTRSTDQEAYVDLQWEKAVSPNLKVFAHATYDWYRYWGDYAYDDPPVTINHDSTLGDSAGIRTYATWTGLPHQTLSFGGDIQLNLTQTQQNYDLFPRKTFLDVHDSSTQWGLYVEDELRLGTGVIVSTGLRLDRFRGLSEFSPRVALVVNPGPSTTAKLIFGRSTRPANEFERLYYADGPPLEMANPDLRPEIFTTGELVLERSLGGHLKVSAAGFISRIDDLISLVTRSDNGALQYQNAQTIDSWGSEFELTGRWAPGLSARASYSYQETTSEPSDNVLSNSPRHLVKLNAIAPLRGDELTIGMEMQYTSSRVTLAGQQTGGFTIVNATLFSRPLGRSLDLSASVYNLFNRRYGEPGGPEHLQDLIPQDGRSFRLKLTGRF
jgi:outer membrane receptor for ferrienterochelin and colicins